MRRSLLWLLDHHPETFESLASLYATALAHAELVDRLGFDALWIAEHHFQAAGRKLGSAPNPAVVLAALARCTERIRLGPAVAVLPLRDPILVAEDYALVDLLSGGRLNMGVGTGSRPLEFEAMGVAFEERRAIFDVRRTALRGLWSATASQDREAVALNVAPLQAPSPPLYVAAMHEESAHAVGLDGDSLLTLVSPLAQDPSEIARRIEAHARGLAEGGHDGGRAEAVVAVFAHVADTEAAARRTAAPALARLVQALVGVAPEHPDDLYERMRERDTGLFGTPESVAAQIERYAAMGVRHIAFASHFGGIEAGAAEASLRHLAPARPDSHAVPSIAS